MTGMLAAAAAAADKVLYPAAAEVDRTGLVPDSHFALLAAEGFYGLFAPREAGGPGLAFTEALRVVETLAGGCLATTFVWLQHHGIVMALLMTPNTELRARLLAPAVRGEVRGGGAFSGVVHTPPRVRAVRRPGGWSVSGRVPFVSGWGIVDLLHVSAHDETTGEVVSGLVNACPGPGIAAVEPLTLVAGQGTNTVSLELRDLVLPDEQVTTRTDRAAFLAGLAIGLRVDSALALGLTDRAVRLLAEAEPKAADALRSERDDLRDRFDTALGEPDRLPALRAACSELTQRACTALVVAGGGAALSAGHPAQRLAREALFTLVVASRPAVRSRLLDLLAGPADLGRVPALAAVGGRR
ncbi:probable acyl-CoA dehydrogenase [Alloactinosynnema sp. L-07]|uniref:acyl-CoA dehydrogenase family protein n=1 Tax=Alloactinosynnema sp. L-07 TaxID=1653480 RepID=UPI00065F00B9|nr:acyl-CoA dehydrogenase family protein [Alloactinosynnema sp. L-07]CRK61975.1 probable acyl-CoA dehydrogenase [Alloactinosynnema sp. L-07]